MVNIKNTGYTFNTHVVKFTDNGVETVIYTSNPLSYQSMVNNHKHLGNFRSDRFVPSSEQSDRLAKLNEKQGSAFIIDPAKAANYIMEISDFVQFGFIDISNASVLKPLAEAYRDSSKKHIARILKDILSEIRYEHEVSGVMYKEGYIVNTDKTSQTVIASTLNALVGGMMPSVSFKFKDNVFMSNIGVNEFTKIAMVTLKHVQDSFTSEEIVGKIIDNATLEELVKIDEGVAGYDVQNNKVYNRVYLKALFDKEFNKLKG